MIAKLNLASQPFQNRTLPWVVAAFVSCVSILALFLIVGESRKTSAQADAAERDLQALRQQRSALQQQAAEVRESLTPEQHRMLDAAHTLVDRKRFSWSRLLADLEASLPGDVRVSRISVREVSRRGEQTRAELDLSVVGRTPLDVTRMITEMNNRGIFSVVPVTESPRTGRGESGFEWTLRVGYVQRTTSAPASSPAASIGDDTASSSSSSSNIASSPARPQRQPEVARRTRTVEALEQ